MLRLSNFMCIPLFVHIKSLFTRDKNAFWFDHYSDEEKQLRRMDAWQLAAVINEADTHRNNPEKRIVAEHLLNVRLAKIQTRATYISVVAGLVGIVGGVFLTSAFQGSDSQSKYVCEYSHSDPIQKNVPKPVQNTTTKP